MKAKLLTFVLTAVLLCGCAPDGYSVGLLTTRIPGAGPVPSQQLYGFIVSVHWPWPGNDKPAQKWLAEQSAPPELDAGQELK